MHFPSRFPLGASLILGAFCTALAFGCGGSSSSPSNTTTTAPAPADWTSATPSTLPSSSLSDIDVSDTPAESSVELPTGGVVAETVGTSDPCHPALFTRTYEMTDILNNHTHKMMDRIASIVTHPKAADNSANCTVDNKANPTEISCTIDPAAGLFDGYPLTLTWQKSAISTGTQYVTNVYIQASSTSAADLHECELGSKITPAPTFGPCTGGTCPTCTTIFSSTIDVAVNTNGFEASSPSGTPMKFDFTSLNAVDKSETATGNFQVNVDFTMDTTKPNPFRRVLGFAFNDFVPALTASEIAAGEANHGARTGTLAHIGYTGSKGGGGGAMEFVDEVILFCPQYTGEGSNPTLYSDALTVGRWYENTTANPGNVTVFGRVDAEAVGDSGGATPTGNGGGNTQLSSGTDFLGAVCYSGVVNASANLTESANDPWMFLEENNGTVTANSYTCGPETTSGNTSTCVSSCGSVFSPLPTVTGTTVTNPYSFNGLTPSISSSGIPTTPSAIETALAPLLCGTGVGTAWTDQSNCP